MLTTEYWCERENHRPRRLFAARLLSCHSQIWRHAAAGAWIECSLVQWRSQAVFGCGTERQRRCVLNKLVGPSCNLSSDNCKFPTDVFKILILLRFFKN